MGSGRVRRMVRGVSVWVALVVAVWMAAAPSAGAYRGWQHATAVGKASCAAGCHFGQPPSNAACTGCHTGFTTTSGGWCWTCHEPGQATSAWQVDDGCTAACHLWTSGGDVPDYSAEYEHAAPVHLGASGYGKSCLDCHGASAGPASPESSPHHDDLDGEPPTCARCHDGVAAAAPAGHEVFGTTCTACHAGMDRPSGDCAACHVGAGGTTIPQIDYTNDLACSDAGCHGAVAVHGATPVAAAPCATCHAPHYEGLATCVDCHPGPENYHHGTSGARPLADCGGCHDGGFAAARTSHLGVPCSLCHGGMDAPSMPTVCTQCHFPSKFGTSECPVCHGPSGPFEREQIHTLTPGVGVTCAGCHDAHHADLGSCDACHGLVPQMHHGAVTVTGSGLTVTATPARVRSGGTTTVRGTLTDGDGVAVAGAAMLLQERRLGAAAFSDVATLTTDASGGFSLQLRLFAGGEYRAVFSGSWSDVAAAVQRPAMRSATVRVVQKVELGARPATSRVRARVRLAGTVRPTAGQLGAARPPVTLRVERRSGTRWVRVASVRARTKADGSFARTWRSKRAGTYRVKAVAAASPCLLAATATVRVRVR